MAASWSVSTVSSSQQKKQRYFVNTFCVALCLVYFLEAPKLGSQSFTEYLFSARSSFDLSNFALQDLCHLSVLT